MTRTARRGGARVTFLLLGGTACSNSYEENYPRCVAVWDAVCSRLFACDATTASKDWGTRSDCESFSVWHCAPTHANCSPGDVYPDWDPDCEARTLATTCEDVLASHFPSCGGLCP